MGGVVLLVDPPPISECKVYTRAVHFGTRSTAMEDESSAFASPPSPKRTKLGGAETCGTKFKLEWMDEFPFITKGRRDSVYSFYWVCKKDVSCPHKGIADVRRHERSKVMYQLLKAAVV